MSSTFSAKAGSLERLKVRSRCGCSRCASQMRVEIAQMANNLTRAHAARVHRDDLVIETRKPALVLGDQLRIEAGLAVAWHLQLDLAGVGDDCLLAIAVAPVTELLAG